MIIAIILGTVCLMVISTILRGYVLATLWGWFVAPTFHITSLSIPVAIGMSVLVSMMTYQSDAKKDREGDLTSAIALAFLVPLFGLALGAFVHMWV
jgi:hypothetical protein